MHSALSYMEFVLAVIQKGDKCGCLGFLPPYSRMMMPFKSFSISYLYCRDLKSYRVQ